MSSYIVTFRGRPACPCLAEWLPSYEAELLRRGVIKNCIDIYQLIGGAAASGGTHATGGAFDIAQTSDEAIAVARQMGADATWHRPYNWDSRGGMSHTHGVLRGCEHNGPARYQIAAVDAGYNGLGYAGHGARDTGPRPLSGRTWREGIKWAAPKPKTSTRAVASWNMGDGQGKLRDLNRLAKVAHVIGLQEAGDRGLILKAFLATHPRWGLFRPNEAPGQSSTPILYKRALFDVIKTAADPAVEERRVVERGVVKVGAGPSVVKAKWLDRLHLVDKVTGRHVHVINTHFIPSATKTDLPAAELTARKQHYTDHARALVREIDRLKGVVIVCGDFNAEADFVPLTPVVAELEGWSTDGTHGSRSIDHVAHRPSSAVEQVGHRLVATSSDHKAVVNTFRLKENLA